MADYELLEPKSLDLATGRPLAGPAKPPRLHSLGDLTDAGLPAISVTAPLESRWEGARPAPRPIQQDPVDRLKLAGSFDSLDSETMVSVGSMADLDTLLAELQTSIGQQGAPVSQESSPAQRRKTPLSTSAASPWQRPSTRGQYTEVVTETTRTVRREVTPPAELGQPAPTGELDSLLQDLNEARYGAPESFSPRIDGGSPAQLRAVAVRSPLPAPAAQFDMVPSPKAKTYETRTVEVTESVPEGGQASSSATQELDDLMASLSDFTIHATSYQRTVVEENAEPPYQPEKVQKLDNMLGSLQEDMSKQGVDTSNKGTCAACDMPIAGQLITALGRTWHTDHFTCTHCNQELGNRNFFEREGRPYCENDYHNLFSPRCANCSGPILDKCVTAMEKTWHPEHFVCAECGIPFGDTGFHERDGRPYCRDDYFRLFAPRCGGCQQPVMENYISALNAQWHNECFVCKDCQRPFENGSFYDHEGQPYCETHYHAKRGSLCASCHKPITGRCVTAMFKKFHPEHFSCSFCLKQLNKGTFKEQEDKPYCHQCFDKLFG